MGHNTANFHGFLHLPETYLNLCAPCHLNTQENENHHMPTKGIAKRTNRHADTFDLDHSKKTTHQESIARAIQELDGQKTKWKHSSWPASMPAPEPDGFDPEVKGPFLTHTYNADTNSCITKNTSKMVGKDKYVFDANTSAFIQSLARDLNTSNGISSITTFGRYTVFSSTEENNRQHYYAMPYNNTRPKQNWGIFNLSDPDAAYPNAHRNVPAHIKCFLDLPSLPPDNAIVKNPGLHAIVEPVVRNISQEERRWSQLVTPWVKKPCTVPGFLDYSEQKLVSLDCLMLPCIMVPDIEHPDGRACLKLTPRRHWGGQFEDWLQLKHSRVYE